MVCGSIGYGGVDKIRQMYTILRRKGFEIVDHLVHKGMDYSDVRDFRNKKELSQQIVSHDLQYIEKADVIIVVANGPSYGTGIEMYIAKNLNKKVILLANDPVPTPWPVNFSDYITRNEDGLITLLEQLRRDTN
ncbi:MAG: nucleoside 2-deoxyribosyltransferase [Nitrososphaeraceae archaeon]|jgi:nucleoside 2-deoxyribosyltransferase